MYINYIFGFVAISFIFGSIQTYHNRYIHRHEEAAQAKLYIESDVCSDSFLRVKLGKYQECAEAEFFLAISPSTRALYDVLEYYSLCGSKQKRCEAVVTWVTQNKYGILATCLLLCYGFYQWLIHEWHMQKIGRMMNTQLLPIH